MDYCIDCDIYHGEGGCREGINKIRRFSKNYTLKQASKEEIAHYDINKVVSIDKDILHHIIRDEMMISLLRELGINDFNKWYVETIGGTAPFMYVKPKTNQMKSPSLRTSDIDAELIKITNEITKLK